MTRWFSFASLREGTNPWSGYTPSLQRILRHKIAAMEETWNVAIGAISSEVQPDPLFQALSRIASADGDQSAVALATSVSSYELACRLVQASQHARDALESRRMKL